MENDVSTTLRSESNNLMLSTVAFTLDPLTAGEVTRTEPCRGNEEFSVWGWIGAPCTPLANSSRGTVAIKVIASVWDGLFIFFSLYCCAHSFEPSANREMARKRLSPGGA
jgi:hypothetical protein